MKISKTMQDELNRQINKEFHSAYLYLAITAYFEDRSLTGFANWYKIQAKEEVSHGMKIFQFILDRDGNVELEQVGKPAASWKSLSEIAQSAYKHEQNVTKSIHDIREFARKEKDAATEEFLNWFVSEQVEEEDNASYLVDRLEIAGSSGEALLLLDKELGEIK